MQNKLRLGIIGAGSVVREIYQHLYFHSEYSHLLDVRAVADPNDVFRNWFGDLAGLPQDKRFTSYQELLDNVELDAVQINTPDHLHCAPTVAALATGLDVVLPKPAAVTIRDTHTMIEAARASGRFLGIDYHKREDPRIKEAGARYQSGRYGTLQVAVFYMLDKLLVANPNHSPCFFASPDFAVKNTPVSFLTVHMADALMKITGLVPAQVRANGFSQKLPSLRPVSVNGYDVVDTEITFTTGAVAHVITGWALPNTAWSTTVQSSRLICSDGMVDLGLDTPGLLEIHPEGVLEINPLFRNFEKDGMVTGYGMSSPGRLYQKIISWRAKTPSDSEREAALSPTAQGFYTTLVLETAEQSLRQGHVLDTGVTLGVTVDLSTHVSSELGTSTAATYGL